MQVSSLQYPFTSIRGPIHLMITEPKQGASILSISLNGRVGKSLFYVPTQAYHQISTAKSFVGRLADS
nr:hypothetical protein Q903MT_gene667 [Picea sitchensis]